MGINKQILELRRVSEERDNAREKLLRTLEQICVELSNVGIEDVKIGDKKYSFILRDELDSLNYYEWEINILKNNKIYTIASFYKNEDGEQDEYIDYILINELIYDLPAIFDVAIRQIKQEKEWYEKKNRKIKEICKNI